jgi:hypothetical protein
MTESIIYHKFIKNVKCNMNYHAIALYNLTFKYYIEEALRKNISTELDIEDMKKSVLYMKYESVEPYFTLLTKNDYTFTELTTIIACLHDNLIVYLDTINILYTTIQNYYGKGKVKLNRDDPEDFIKQISELTSKYDPTIIKKQINIVQRCELVIKSLIKVFDTIVVPILPEKFSAMYNSEKDIAIKQIKNISNDFSSFTGQNIDILKEKYKKDNKDSYKINMQLIDLLLEKNNFKDCFYIIYRSDFDDIKLGDVTKDLQDTYKKYGKELMKFVSFKFPVDKVCSSVSKSLLEKGVLCNILPLYYTNLALYKYINSQ